MRLYLREELSKSSSSSLRGGKYYAKIQDGWKTDGTPKYHYFYSPEEYEKYKNESSGSGNSGTKDLERKVEDEHNKGVEYVHSKEDVKIPSETSPASNRDTNPKAKQERLFVES